MTEAEARTPGEKKLTLQKVSDDVGEQRTEDRFDIEVRGGLALLKEREDAPQGQIDVLVADVSIHGLRLLSQTAVPRGEPALIRFALPGKEARTRKVIIRWVKQLSSGHWEMGAQAADGSDGPTAPQPSTQAASPPPASTPPPNFRRYMTAPARPVAPPVIRQGAPAPAESRFAEQALAAEAYAKSQALHEGADTLAQNVSSATQHAPKIERSTHSDHSAPPSTRELQTQPEQIGHEEEEEEEFISTQKSLANQEYRLQVLAVVSILIAIAAITGLLYNFSDLIPR